MSQFDLEALVRELAAEFKRRDMHRHLAALRRFYAQHRRTERARLLADPSAWNDELVLSWLSLFQIRPFDRVYMELSKEQGCPCGALSRNGAESYVECVFPGGYVWCCRACKASWLVKDGV